LARSVRINIAAKRIEINNLPIMALKYTAKKLSGFFLVNFSMICNELKVSRKKKINITHTLEYTYWGSNISNRSVISKTKKEKR
jgi:hypothetical protein